MFISETKFARPVEMRDGDTVEVIAGQAIFKRADGTIFDRCLVTVTKRPAGGFPTFGEIFRTRT